MRIRGTTKYESDADANLSNAEQEGRGRATATFTPRGLLGRLYWYCVLPFHSYIFNGMIINLTK